MNKAIKIFLAVFILVFAKVLADIPLFTAFLLNINKVDLFSIIGYTSLIGMIVIFLYSKLQQVYPFIYATLFYFLLVFIVAGSYFYFATVSSTEYTLMLTPGFIIIGNLLLFIFLKGLSTRVSDENLFATDTLINYAKYAGLLAGSILILYLFLENKVMDFRFFLTSSLVGILLAFVAMTDLILTVKGGNEILENPQTIKVKNNARRLAQNPFFLVLLVTAITISVMVTFSYRLFLYTSIPRYHTYVTVIRLFGFYTVFIASLGILYECFLRDKMMLYLGIRNSIRLLPIITVLFVAAVLINVYLLHYGPTSDNYFVFLIAAVLLMGLGHFVFENISLPTTYSFYMPINLEIRNDFYVKSFVLGMLSGIPLAFVISKIILYFFDIGEVQILPYTILSGIVVLYYLNSLPVYRIYKKELQNYLDIQSRNLIINKGLFRDIVNNNPDNFKGTQYVRYINLLYLTNPLLARKVIDFSILSEQNFNQRVGLIKAEKLFMLEIIDNLFAIRKSKYFISSPNRDKIESTITRFIEVTQRMESQKYVDQLSISKENNERVFGAKLVYYLKTKDKNKIMKRLLKDPELPVVLNAIISGSLSKEKELIKDITDKLDNPALGNAAYATLLSCGEIVIPILEESYYETGQTEKVQLRIIQLYGEFANEEATEYLLKKLNISNQNIISSALSSLSKCTLTLSEEKTAMLKHELEELCQILVWNLSFCVDLGKNTCSKALTQALDDEVETNFNRMFNLLSLLYDAKSVKLTHSNLFSSDLEKINFALELASVLLKDEIKLLILPLLQPLGHEEKVRIMQNQIPTEKLNKKDVLHALIQRESKWINQWTKACAMAELTEDFRDSDITLLIAHMINPDTMIAELAISSLIGINREVYFENKSIFGEKFLSLFDNSFLTRIENIDVEKKPEFPFLKYEIINYLQQIPELSEISGEILKKLTDNIIPIKIQAGEIIEEIDNVDIQNYFYVLFSGSVTLLINNQHVKTYGKESFISTIDLMPDEQSRVSLYCDKDSILYQISSHGFIELLTLYDIIPESIIRQSNNKKLNEFEDYIKRRTTYRYIPQTLSQLQFHHQN
jgi:ATP:ADP antiporter, AAA family